MMARGFKPVGWVAGVAGAALGCYMLSLNVAAERADLAKLERQIASAKRDIRTLQTELNTRGRLQQLEHWNAEVLALSAPTSAQYLDDAVTLARFERQEKTVEERAPVQLASAEVPAPKPARRLAPADYAAAAALAATEPKPIVHQAAFVPAPKPLVRTAAAVKPPVVKMSPKPAAEKVAATAEPAKKKAGPATKAAESAKPAAPKKLADAKPMSAKKLAEAKPAAAKKAEAKPAKEKKRSTGMLDDALVKELGAASKAEKSGSGAGGR